MEERAPVPFQKVSRLMAGLFLRRFGNRMLSGLRRGRSGFRAGTGRKGVGSPLALMAVAVAFPFYTLSITSQALKTLASELGPAHDAAGRVVIDRLTKAELRDFQFTHQHSRARRDAALERIFLQESQAGNPTSPVDYARNLAQWYDQEGLQGFVSAPRRESLWFPQLRGWHDPALSPLLLHALGLILLILAGARHCWTLGSRNQDLGQLEWSTEWLFTLPASSRALFAAQILGHALVDPISWIGTIPLLLVAYLSTGAGWAAAAGAAVCNSIYLSLVMASLRIVSETWLRKRLAPARLKNLQALFTLVGIVLIFLLFALARSREVIQWVVRLALHRWPLLVWNPFSIPAAAFSARAGVVAGWEIGSVAVIFAGSIALCSFLVREGLVSAPAAYGGERGAGVTGGDFLPSGIIGKDLRLLLRDRNFFVQTLVAPGLIVCFQVVFNVGMAQSIGSNFHLAATFAFAVGAYVMISTGLNVLAVEGNSLWMLYGLPVPLPTIMLRKTLLWAVLGLCYAAAVLAICGWHIGRLSRFDLPYITVALAGVIIYSFIASGMGMLATDPLEVEVKRRIRPGMIYLYMILASLYGYALYANSTWARLGQIVLSALLAYALWQKVRDRAPFLLDAVSMPPPRVSLADGLIAALGLLVLQGGFSYIYINLQMSPAGALVLAYATAGALVVGFTLAMYWRARVPGVLSAIGLRAPGQGRRTRAVLIGLALGVAGAGAAYCYLLAIHHIPRLERLGAREEPLMLVSGWLLALLAVVAAPLFEEFIFRGLIFRGMRRSLPARWAITGSAAVFAICHPPISAAPVFVMGALAALSFEITGWIVTPICVHMTYNGLVLLTGFFQHGGGF